MKRSLILAFTIGFAALSIQGIASQQKTATQKTAAKSGAKAQPPAPVAVEVVAVDPQAKTITVRDIAAVPADKPVAITLPVPASATGEKLSDVKVGQKVAVTCTIKPTVHPTAGVPIVLTDCARVIKIEPSSK
jgi:hypothetical protein